MGELSVREMLESAVKKHNEGKLDDAETLYKKILDKDPCNSDAFHLLGLIAYHREKYEDAMTKISYAIKLKPNTALYHGNLGMVYDKLGKENESIENFKTALEIDPYYPGAHRAYYNLGIFYAERGEIGKSLEYYNRAIELEPAFFDARWNRSFNLLLLGKFREGWKDYECRFKKKSPTDSRIFDKPRWGGFFSQRQKNFNFV